MKAASNTAELIGNTPLVRIHRMATHVKANIYCKLEYMNPGGSVKDRPALQIILDAEAAGELKPGGTIVEATSGNTGMGLALIAAIKGYKTIFVMPDKMSDEKISSLRAVGARVVVTPTAVEPEDPRSYYSVARRLVEETPNAFYSNQYHNPSNPRAHYLTTGPEIWEQTDGEIDVFVCSIGTGGTISGIAKYLKEKNPNIKVVGVDPVGSLYYDYFRTGKLTKAYSYLVEGFGEDFLPGTMDFSYIDEVIRVTDADCFHATRDIVRKEGIFAGGSSGGAVAAAIKYAERTPDKPLNIVTIMCDSMVRYLSKIFSDQWMETNGFLGANKDLGLVRDLINQKEGPQTVVTASADETVREVVAKMKAHDVSQLPVIEGVATGGHVKPNMLKGIIAENDLLDFLLTPNGTPESSIGALIKANFSVVEPANSIAILGQLFSRGQIVLVIDEDRVRGIVTKIDYIDYVSERINP